MSQIDHELVRRRLEAQLADYRFKTHLMPINNREGFHISFPGLPRLMNPKTKEDFKNYVARLNDFPRFTDEQIELLRGGIAAGLIQPAMIMRDSVAQAQSHVVEDADNSLLLQNISAETREALGEESWNEIAAEIRGAVKTSVIPAYEKFARFLAEEYLPACRGPVGASAMPGGREFYRDRIRRFTTLDLTPEELHETGLRENARIRAEMEAIRQSVGFEGDLPAFLQHLRTDPKFYATTPEQLLKEVALILKTADGRLPELFGRLPRIPYGIREIPAYVAPQTTSAYYWPPATDGSRAGFYYVNTYNLSSRPLYQLEALSLHEAVPGHHLQLALQAELTELHPISRQSDFTAFIEGWALYSERLGKEIGFYKDPYQEFGRLSMEAWRASRLVVDTGIHWMGWSREQADRLHEGEYCLERTQHHRGGRPLHRLAGSSVGVQDRRACDSSDSRSGRATARRSLRRTSLSRSGLGSRFDSHPSARRTRPSMDRRATRLGRWKRVSRFKRVARKPNATLVQSVFASVGICLALDGSLSHCPGFDEMLGIALGR